MKRASMSLLTVGALAMGVATSAQAAPTAGAVLDDTLKSLASPGLPKAEQVTFYWRGPWWRHRHHNRRHYWRRW